MKNLSKFGVQIPDILLPKNVDLKTWAVIACDQYTQEKDYWAKTAEIAGDKPSTLNLIFPEVYLNDADCAERIGKIKRTMREYLSEELFNCDEECIYIERKTEYGRTRRGLILAVDLEKYEWKPDSKALIRATEATVPERIPPRMKIRNGAALELPHIMLLANDPDDVLVGGAEKLAKENQNQPLYDGDLMMNAGHLTGWSIKGGKAEKMLENALSSLYKAGTDSSGNTFLFAVGDGNHSLATAKAVWDDYKKLLPESEKETSPIRYALVEVVNIYDKGLTFEPIHRVIFNQDSQKLIDFVQKKLGGEIKSFADEKELESFVADKTAKGARFGFITKNSLCVLETKITDLAIAALQPVLDEYLDANSNDKKNDIDYIHGTDEVVRLGKKDNALSILLPPIAKDSFFATINGRGPLPRKSFSMGEASEKRFYVEARKLF